jgi:DNA polymerase-4
MLRWLFLDMNSFFASVEQQERPELRGRPVAVVPVEADTTSCIAVSPEAKPFGIRTGTAVAMARHLCPRLQVVVARPPLYVEYHKQIVAVVERHLHVTHVKSIDEMACRLPSNESAEPDARSIAGAIKAALRRDLGECIRCSIGIAPNCLLAKVASDLQKPDGLVVLRGEDLPGPLLLLRMTDLPGVARNLQVRLAAHGYDTVEALWHASPDDLARAWGGVLGRRFWRGLHGEDVPELTTRRGSITHANVLAPEFRTPERAHAVLVRLIHKAAARLRHMGHAAGHLGLHVMFEDHTGWSANRALDDAQDTQTLLDAADALWAHRPPGTPKRVGITLYALELARNLTLPLFPPDERRLHLSRAMDRVNAKFGRQTLYFAEMHTARGAAPMRIAFNSIPDGHW